jgi:hypothetical protein
MKKIVLLLILLLAGCSGTYPKINVVWPKPPTTDEVLVIVSSDTAYVAPSEFYQIGLNKDKSSKLFFGDCTYFYINTRNANVFYQFRGMSNDFPGSHFELNDLEFGQTHYFERDLVVSRDPINSIFVKSNLGDALTICKRFGFNGQRFEIVDRN